jgi:signal transduction histidine kinase
MIFNEPLTQYSLRNRAERLIAAGRVLLAAFFILAIWFDPTEPVRYAGITRVILIYYLGYAIFLALIVWTCHFLGNRSNIIVHAFDLITFSCLMALTEGPTSPFFIYFVFLLICATVHWQWQGTLWTAMASISAAICMAWYPQNLFADPQFEVNRFVTRSTDLGVMAALLGYMGTHEYNLRATLLKLAAWPLSFPTDLRQLMQETLAHSAAIIDTPRLLVLWEEMEEPFQHSAVWAGGEVTCQREPYTPIETLVAAPLHNTSFFCTDTHKPLPAMVRTQNGDLRRWMGVPLTEATRARFSIGAVLCVPLHGEHHQGYLMALDMAGMSTDDLALGDILARELSNRLDHFYLLQQLRTAAAAEERLQLARDLHDGFLQSLAGVALQLQSVLRLLEDDNSQTAGQRIREIQLFLAEEQMALRSHIMDLRPTAIASSEVAADLNKRLTGVVECMKNHHGLSVELHNDDFGTDLSGKLAQEIYFLVHEGLINAARHAGASTTRIEIRSKDGQIQIMVADNGHGFPFHGRYDLAELIRDHIGPATIKERVGALGGSLVINSGKTGTTLEICLPLHPCSELS